MSRWYLVLNHIYSNTRVFHSLHFIPSTLMVSLRSGTRTHNSPNPPNMADQGAQDLIIDNPGGNVAGGNVDAIPHGNDNVVHVANAVPHANVDILPAGDAVPHANVNIAPVGDAPVVNEPDIPGFVVPQGIGRGGFQGFDSTSPGGARHDASLRPVYSNRPPAPPKDAISLPRFARFAI